MMRFLTVSESCPDAPHQTCKAVRTNFTPELKCRDYREANWRVNNVKVVLLDGGSHGQEFVVLFDQHATRTVQATAGAEVLYFHRGFRPRTQILELVGGETSNRESQFQHPITMRFELHQFPDPSPPPIKEPPDGPEQPDVLVREPDPDEPSKI
jgi:hypothetical protein